MDAIGRRPELAELLPAAIGEPLANHWRTIGEPAELLPAVAELAELAADGARPPAG